MCLDVFGCQSLNTSDFINILLCFKFPCYSALSLKCKPTKAVTAISEPFTSACRFSNFFLNKQINK